MPQTVDKKRGRPFQGHTEPVMTRVAPEAKSWLQALVRKTGIREGDIVRRIIDDARDRQWSPT